MLHLHSSWNQNGHAASGLSASAAATGQARPPLPQRVDHSEFQAGVTPKKEAVGPTVKRFAAL